MKEIKNKKGFKLIKNPHGGKALTVISGMLKTVGEIAVFTDMDQATPINQIERFFPQFEKKYDVVIGSRQGRAGAPIMRKITAFVQNEQVKPCFSVTGGSNNSEIGICALSEVYF